MATIRYRNRKTGKVANYASPMRLLEKSDDWEREPENGRPYPTAKKKSPTKRKTDAKKQGEGTGGTAGSGGGSES